MNIYIQLVLLYQVLRQKPYQINIFNDSAIPFYTVLKRSRGSKIHKKGSKFLFDRQDKFIKFRPYIYGFLFLFFRICTYIYRILTPSKISKREFFARKRAALFNHEQTHSRLKKLGVFANFITHQLPLLFASVILVYDKIDRIT